MTRDQKIELLADNDFNSFMNGDILEILDSYLKDGFKGYSNFTDMELNSEIKERKIMGVL